MNLRSLDLNLLVVFDAIYSELSVTRAADRVCLSQSATSNALARLRHQLKDELFLRGVGGLRPTSRSNELAPHVNSILADLQELLEPQGFDPATTKRSVKIAAVDFFSIVIAPHLMEILAREAPQLKVRILSPAGRSLEALDLGEVDFAIAAFGPVPDRFGQSILIEDDYSCLVRKGHPLLGKKQSIRRFSQSSHLLVSPRGDARGFVDDELAKVGLTRHIGLVIDYFAAAPPIIGQSDLVLTAPTSVLNRLKTSEHIMFKSPIDLPADFRCLDMIWHNKLSRHPALEWIRGAIERASINADIQRD